MEAAPQAGPSDGAGSGARDRELLQALDLQRAGRSQPGIAAALWGPEALAGVWDENNKYRKRVRRCLDRAEHLVTEGYLKLAAQP